jgi:hypothetical protein
VSGKSALIGGSGQISVLSTAVDNRVLSAPQHDVLIPDAPAFVAVHKTPATGKSGRFELPLDSVSGAIAGAHAGEWNRKGALLVTAKDVELALGDPLKLDRHVPIAYWPLVQAAAQALTPEGVLGSRGPLSSRGAVGFDPHNPSQVMKAVGGWRSASEMLSMFGGPGSELGSLGAFGPTAGWAKAMLPFLGPLAAQLEAGKLFGVLGPDGVLGAKGPLGYLGTVGGHGFALDARGNFKSARGIERNTDVRYLGSKRSLQLVELYRESDAAQVKKQDTSWIVDGRIEAGDPDGDTFRFHAKKGQLLTLAVVPERLGDTFAVDLYDRSGRLVARSDSDRFVNFIQMRAPKGGELFAKITVKARSEVEPVSPVTAWIDLLLAPLGIEQRPSGAYRLVCAPG